MIPPQAGYLLALFVLGAFGMLVLSVILRVTAGVYLSQNPAPSYGRHLYVPEMYVDHAQRYKWLLGMSSATGWTSAAMWLTLIVAFVWMLYF